MYLRPQITFLCSRFITDYDLHHLCFLLILEYFGCEIKYDNFNKKMQKNPYFNILSHKMIIFENLQIIVIFYRIYENN